MESYTYKQTIDEIKKLKKEDTIEKLIQNTLKFENLDKIVLKADEKQTISTHIEDLKENQTKHHQIKNYFDKFINAYFETSKYINIKEIFNYFYTNKDNYTEEGYIFNDDTITRYEEIINEFQEEYDSLKKKGETGNIIWIKEYTCSILFPYFKRKIEIYKCKKKIRKNKDDIDTLLNKIEQFKNIDDFTCKQLNIEIKGIEKMYNNIIHFFCRDSKDVRKQPIKRMLNKIKETELNQSAESQYRQYTYQKS